MEIEKYEAIAARPAIQKALRRIELFVNNLHVRKSTREFWEQLKRESFESINAELLPQDKETKTMETKKTIADLKDAMWERFKELPKHLQRQAYSITTDNDGDTWACLAPRITVRGYWIHNDVRMLGRLDITKYPHDAWKQSLIHVRDGKRVEETDEMPRAL